MLLFIVNIGFNLIHEPTQTLVYVHCMLVIMKKYMPFMRFGGHEMWRCLSSESQVWTCIDIAHWPLTEKTTCTSLISARVFNSSGRGHFDPQLSHYKPMK